MLKPFKGNYEFNKERGVHGDEGAYDYPLAQGTPLYAVADGVVQFVRSSQHDDGGGEGTYGNIVLLHTAWNGKDISVGYLHMQRNSATVKKGDNIREGHMIGKSGNSGNSTGAHLHIFATEGHRPANSYGDCFTGKAISPVDQLWMGGGEPTGGDNAPIGDSESGSNQSSSSTGELSLTGSFAEVKKYLTPEALKEGAEFNPPTPIPYLEAGFDKGRPGRNVNLRGYIVRDPLFNGVPSTPAVDTTAQTPPAGADAAPTTTADAANGSGDWLAFTKKYGFRFHYNPEEVSEAYSTSYAVDPIRFSQDLAGVGAPVGITGGTVNFNLLLNRKADVHLLNSGKDYSKAYSETLTEEHAEALKTRGTLVDIEYLVRLCNGDPQQLWSGTSSDWGLLIPTMVIVSLGDGANSRRLRAQVTGINITHQQFYSGMIPTHTVLSLTLARISDAYYQASEDAQGGAAPSGDAPTETEAVLVRPPTETEAVLVPAQKIPEFIAAPPPAPGTQFIPPPFLTN